MFWSKARKIRKLEAKITELSDTINKQVIALSREKDLKAAAQTSDIAYRKIAAERGDELEKLKQELELMTASNKGAQGEAAQNAEAYGHALLERSQEIEQLKGAYEYELKLRREFEEELGRVRGELAALKAIPPELEASVQYAVGTVIPGRDDPILTVAPGDSNSRTKDFTP